MSAWQAEVLAAGTPSAWYQLGDAALVMADASGNARDGTHSANVAATTGLVPGDPSGASNYPGGGVSVVADAAWMNTGHVAVVAWGRLPNTSGEHFIAGRDNNGGDLRWRLDVSGTTLRWIINVGGLQVIQAAGVVAATTDYMWVATHDGTTARLYQYTGGVGGQVASAAVSGNILATSGREIRIGAQSTGAAIFGGPIDEVVIYPAAISAAAVTALAAATWVTPPHVPTGLAASGETTTTVDLDWVAPTTGGAPTSYQVRVDGGAPTDVGLVLAHTVTGLTDATTYLFEVRSIRNTVASAWVSVSATTDTAPPPPPPPPGGYAAHLRVGAHVWDVAYDPEDPATPEYGPVAGLQFSWSAPQDDGWPTQHHPTVLSFGVIVAQGEDFDDVDQDTWVHFTFTPDGFLDPLVEFGGYVRDLVARPVALGMLYDLVAVDPLQKLQEDYHTSVFLPSGTATGDIWAELVQDGGGSLGTEPTLPDPLAGQDVPDDGGFTGVDVTVDGSTWDVLTGFSGSIAFRAGATPPSQRVILTYQLDGSGDLDAAAPFLGTWVQQGSDDLIPAVLDAELLFTAGTEWSRPRIEPNTVVTPFGTVVRTHTGPDIVRTLTGSVPFRDTYEWWIIDGVEADSQWSTLMELAANQAGDVVASWFTLPDAMRTFVTTSTIDPRHTPDGSGDYAGLLSGARLVIHPGGSWTVQFSLRRTLPTP